MTVEQLQRDFRKSLEGQYDSSEVSNFFIMLADHLLGFRRIELSMNSQQVLSDDQIDDFRNALNRLKKNEPIQYIIGNTEFYGLPFQVNPSVLIPRPETEELVEWILKDAPDMQSELRVLDLGTGSGCIAVSLSKNRKLWDVTAVDFSPAALETASKNAITNQVEITFLQGDMLKPIDLEGRFDIIVSNPPYVRESERPQMHANVTDYEPASALFVPHERPLLFYEGICHASGYLLEEGGLLYLEINEFLGEETVKLLENRGFNKVELRKDFRQRPRFIKARKP